MDENINKPDQEDEFQFSDTSTSSADIFAAPQAKKKSAGIFTRRNIFIVIGIIVVALSAYKLLSVFSREEEKMATQTTASFSTPPVTPTQITPTQPQQPIQPVQPMQPSGQDQQQSQQQIQTVNSKLDNLQANSVQNNAITTALQSRLMDLTNSVATLQSTVNTMSNQIQTLMNMIQQQQATIHSLKSKAPKAVVTKKKFTVVKVLNPIRVYVLRAMIPGRAWLVGPDGMTISVTVGDIIPGYGVVKIIDPARGKVITSTGAIIRYNKS